MIYNSLIQYIPDKVGDFIDFDTGAVIGQHLGFHHWTIGQRCRIAGSLKGYFVMHKLSQQNIIIVTSGTDHLALHTDILYTDKPHWINGKPFEIENVSIFRCMFRFQHTKPLIDCMLYYDKKDDSLIVKLSSPLRAITPGQYAVFYKNNECLGSARIIQPGPSLFEQQTFENTPD